MANLKGQCYKEANEIQEYLVLVLILQTPPFLSHSQSSPVFQQNNHTRLPTFICPSLPAPLFQIKAPTKPFNMFKSIITSVLVLAASAMGSEPMPGPMNGDSAMRVMEPRTNGEAFAQGLPPLLPRHQSK